MLKVTEERLAENARTILKSNWLTKVELEEIKRNADGEEQRMSSADVFGSACFWKRGIELDYGGGGFRERVRRSGIPVSTKQMLCNLSCS